MPAGRIVVGILLLAALGVLIKFFLMLAGVCVPSASITGQKPPVEQTPAPPPEPATPSVPAPGTAPPATSEPESVPMPPPASEPDAEPQPDAGQRPEAGEGQEPKRDEPSGETDEDADRGTDTGNGETVADQGAAPGRPGGYVVRRGDTLWGIARRFCGAGRATGCSTAATAAISAIPAASGPDNRSS